LSFGFILSGCALSQIANPTVPRAFRPDYWDGVTRTLATSPLGNVAAISAHNCYSVKSNPAGSLAATLTKIHAAMAAGADLIELDIKSEGGVVYVDHDDKGTTWGAYLEDVLADPFLRAGDQILFIESKETQPDSAYISKVLTHLSDNGYGRLGRPVVIRSFSNIRQNLILTRAALRDPAFRALRPWIKLNELFSKNQVASIATFQQLIAQSRQDGFHGVEFHYQDSNLFGKIVYARSLGLGVNLWTIPVSLGEVFLAGLREEVDALTVDYPVDKARQVVQDRNLLLYLNAWPGDGSLGTVQWWNGIGVLREALTGHPGTPDYSSCSVGEELFGGVLDLEASKQEIVKFYDADNVPWQGYFITAVVKFDDLALADGETSAILSKADSGGFALELHNPIGSGTTVLRFGVYVGGYVYGTVPVSVLNTTDSFLLTGAYDGDGGVWLWVNHSSDNLTKGQAFGGVGLNNSPVLLGADPQGTASSRFHFSGKVQQVQVQRWGQH
jgi:glycerophosphoryl diester phosphodiesterase